MAFKTKAESSFEEKLERAIKLQDWGLTERLFAAYGEYLWLIEPMPETVHLIWTGGKTICGVEISEDIKYAAHWSATGSHEITCADCLVELRNRSMKTTQYYLSI